MNNFCHMPFNSLEISPDGTCQVCCKIKKPILDLKNNPYNLNTHTLDEVWNSKDINLLREKFLNDEKPKECELCWIEESSNNKSLREHSFRIPKKEQPKVEYLVLKLSNFCNLKCRICGPELSTQWLSELNKNGWLTAAERARLEKNKTEKLNVENMGTIASWLPNISRLLAYGGEPFINEELKKVITLCEKLDVSKNIFFTANTNGTIYTDTIIESLSKFKDVCLLFSIDDINERFEFQRKNARWSQVEENLNKFHKLTKPFNMGFFPTLSLLNIFNLKEYLNWTLKYPNFKVLVENTLHAPQELSLRNAPKNLKLKMLELISEIDIEKYNVENKNCLNVINNFINLEPDVSYVDEKKSVLKIHQFLTKIDEIRGENYMQSIPELGSLQLN